MRTTIRLDDGLFHELKRLAAQTHRTLAEIIEGALRESLARRNKAVRRVAVRLPVFKGRGLNPGVDLDHSAALTELMEGRA